MTKTAPTGEWEGVPPSAPVVDMGGSIIDDSHHVSPFVRMERAKDDPPEPKDKVSPLAKVGEFCGEPPKGFPLGVDSQGSMIFKF